MFTFSSILKKVHFGAKICHFLLYFLMIDDEKNGALIALNYIARPEFVQYIVGNAKLPKKWC